MTYEEIVKKLEALKNLENVEGMARFGINPKTKVFGVPIPELRKIAKIIKKNNELAIKLWDSKIHEAQLLASMIADPERLTLAQIKKWVNDFDSWDICDQVCMNLFVQSRMAKNQIPEFATARDEFVKRTAFALMAAVAVHDKEMKDKDFVKYFPLIKTASTDDRNFVKKAVNWALRQIGKKNQYLNAEAVKLAEEIHKLDSSSAQWISGDAIRELTSEAVQTRLKNKSLENGI